MTSPSSPTLDEVMENIMENVQIERAKQYESQENVYFGEVREEIKEVEGESGEERAFFTNKGVEAFKKILAKKGFVKERGFKELVPPFKEEIEKRGWEAVFQHLEQGRRSLVKEFYANLEDRRNLICYVKGRWVPFGERAISQLFGLRERENCIE